MNAREIFNSLEHLEIYDMRRIYDHYGELVFEKKYVKEWIEALTELLGEPQKPAGNYPEEEDIELTKDYRGIRREQTLFFKKFDDCSILAMLWPWSSSNVTLIVARIEEK